jgi:hypothetical protein
MVGNPAAIERAVKNAIPETDKARRDQARLSSELAKEEKKRDRIMDAVGDGVFTKEQARRKLADIDERADYLRGKLGEIDALLARVPDADELGWYVQEIETSIGTSIFVYDDEGNKRAGGNDLGSWLHLNDPTNGQGLSDRRRLVESVFSGSLLPEGKPAGVYVFPKDRPMRYEIRGALNWRRRGSCPPSK